MVNGAGVGCVLYRVGVDFVANWKDYCDFLQLFCSLYLNIHCLLFSSSSDNTAVQPKLYWAVE